MLSTYIRLESSVLVHLAPGQTCDLYGTWFIFFSVFYVCLKTFVISELKMCFVVKVMGKNTG